MRTEDRRDLHVQLIRSGHVRVEDLHRDRDEARVGHPGAVVARLDFTQLIRSHLLQRRLVGFWVVTDGNLR